MCRIIVTLLVFLSACTTSPTVEKETVVTPPQAEYIDPALMERLQDAANQWHTETRLARLGVERDGERLVATNIDRVDLLRIKIRARDRSVGVTGGSFETSYVFGTETNAARCVELRVTDDGQIERAGEVGLDRGEPPAARTYYGQAGKVRVPSPQRVVTEAVRLCAGKRVSSIELRWEMTAMIINGAAHGGGWFGWRVRTDEWLGGGFVLPANLGDANADLG